MKAVLLDMDGTLVDSEKLWEIALQELYDRLGAELTPDVRESTVGGSAEVVMQIVYRDLGLPSDPEAMAATADWLHDVAGELFDGGLSWCEGARELLDALVDAEIPMALVTNTRRALTERALNSIGRHYFIASVCGDEVPNGKPAPDPYRRAAALLELEPSGCLAIEDSVAGAAAAQDAGCPVLVVPNDVVVPSGPGRRHLASLAGLSPERLRQIYEEIYAEIDPGLR